MRSASLHQNGVAANFGGPFGETTETFCLARLRLLPEPFLLCVFQRLSIQEPSSATYPSCTTGRYWTWCIRYRRQHRVSARISPAGPVAHTPKQPAVGESVPLPPLASLPKMQCDERRGVARCSSTVPTNKPILEGTNLSLPLLHQVATGSRRPT